MADPPSRLSAALAGRYRIERELGAGGMATVWLAHDVRHDRKVALKVLRPELAAVLGAERFLAEIKTTANLQHPHILPLHDSGEVEGSVFYVMPYVQGESLRERLAREKQLPIDEAVRITKEVAGALDYAHRQGVIHRDIKPENILLHDGQALVADFGIALAAANTGGNRMTETGMSLGTPTYMSPEQAMGERTLDARTDVYALGCVLYEMLAGEPPFSGGTAQAIVAKVLTEKPARIIARRERVPEHVEDAVLTALEKLPADRFASASEFALALSGEGAAVPRRAAARRRTAAVQSPKWMKVAIGTLAATTVLAFSWGAWEATRHQTGAPAPVIRFHIPLSIARAPAGNILALSPDGGVIVFVEFLPGRATAHLSMRRLDRDGTVPIAGTDGALSPFFSPDGEWVAFAERTRLRKVRLDGTGLATIADLGSADFVGMGAWRADGTITFTTRNNYVYLVNAAGGTAQRITKQAAQIQGPPIWLPGGKILLSLSTVSRSGAEMVAVSAKTGEQLAKFGPGLALQLVATGDLVWVSPEGAIVTAPFSASRLQFSSAPVVLEQAGISFGGRGLVAAVATNGTLAYPAVDWSARELALVSPSGGTTALPLGKAAFRGPRFSPDGRRIVVDVEPGGDLVGDIWSFDRGSGTFTKLTLEGTSVFPEWTPDGNAVLYSAVGKDGTRAIYRVPIDRSTAPTLVVGGAWPVFEAVLSPDGKTLLFRENADSSGRDILSMPLGGKATAFAASAFQERSPTFSRDGRLVAYVSDESGRDEVYVRPLDGAGRAQLSNNGGAEPRWGPLGQVYYWNQDTLLVAPVTMSPSLSVGARRVVLAGSYARELFHANFDVAPDGRSFVFVRTSASTLTPDVIVVLNGISGRSRAGVR